MEMNRYEYISLAMNCWKWRG